MAAFNRLTRFIKSSPVITASLQAGGLMCVGDLISQKIIEKREKIDFSRTARFGMIGCFMVGPVLSSWYGFLERSIKFQSTALTATGKMVADQAIMAPVFLATFIGLNSFTQGNSWSQVKTDVSSTYSDILISNYQLWPAVQMFNFWVVPLNYRVLFVQTVAVSWNTYLSWKTNSVR